MKTIFNYKLILFTPCILMMSLFLSVEGMAVGNFKTFSQFPNSKAWFKIASPTIGLVFFLQYLNDDYKGILDLLGRGDDCNLRFAQKKYSLALEPYEHGRVMLLPTMKKMKVVEPEGIRIFKIKGEKNSNSIGSNGITEFGSAHLILGSDYWELSSAEQVAALGTSMAYIKYWGPLKIATYKVVAKITMGLGVGYITYKNKSFPFYRSGLMLMTYYGGKHLAIKHLAMEADLKSASQLNSYHGLITLYKNVQLENQYHVSNVCSYGKPLMPFLYDPCGNYRFNFGRPVLSDWIEHLNSIKPEEPPKGLGS